MSDPKQIFNIISTSLSLATGVSAIDRLQDAWSHTRNLRENGGCGDENLAIAEHYLYARYFVAEGGLSDWTKMQTLIIGYNTIKIFGGKGLLPQTGKCKVTSSSKLDIAWSFQGADDGLNDYYKGSKTAIKLEAPQPPQ